MDHCLIFGYLVFPFDPIQRGAMPSISASHRRRNRAERNHPRRGDPRRWLRIVETLKGLPMPTWLIYLIATLVVLAILFLVGVRVHVG